MTNVLINKKDNTTNKNIRSDYFQKISNTLYQKYSRDNKNNKLIKVKELLTFIAKQGYILFNLPSQSPFKIESLLEINEEWNNWKKFNKSHLNKTLKRLKEQKIVDIQIKANQQIIRITKKGQIKVLRYAVEELSLKKTVRWDRKWRLVIYDIPASKRQVQEQIRKSLKKMDFYQIQESVYLTPYPCFEEIEFLRGFYSLEDQIKILTINELENDSAYRTYFGM